MTMVGVESVRGSGSGRGEALPLDLTHLRRFTMGDEQLEQEILGLFFNQLPVTIADLKNAQSEKEWGMAAHTLKGSARAVGAWSLASMAENAECLKPLSDAAERGLVLRRIEEAAGEARSFIASLPRVA
jgi:HPt (histidine-containing phosphotransfer) domain-containing protein